MGCVGVSECVLGSAAQSDQGKAHIRKMCLLRFLPFGIMGRIALK